MAHRPSAQSGTNNNPGYFVTGCGSGPAPAANPRALFHNPESPFKGKSLSQSFLKPTHSPSGGTIGTARSMFRLSPSLVVDVELAPPPSATTSASESSSLNRSLLLSRHGAMLEGMCRALSDDVDAMVVANDREMGGVASPEMPPVPVWGWGSEQQPAATAKQTLLRAPPLRMRPVLRHEGHSGIPGKRNPGLGQGRKEMQAVLRRGGQEAQRPPGMIQRRLEILAWQQAAVPQLGIVMTSPMPQETRAADGSSARKPRTAARSVLACKAARRRAAETAILWGDRCLRTARIYHGTDLRQQPCWVCRASGRCHRALRSRLAHSLVSCCHRHHRPRP